jgi:hypothetical protein
VIVFVDAPDNRHLVGSQLRNWAVECQHALYVDEVDYALFDALRSMLDGPIDNPRMVQNVSASIECRSGVSHTLCTNNLLTYIRCGLDNFHKSSDAYARAIVSGLYKGLSAGGPVVVLLGGMDSLKQFDALDDYMLLSTRSSPVGEDTPKMRYGLTADVICSEVVSVVGYN